MSYASENLMPGESMVYAAQVTRMKVWIWLALAGLIFIIMPVALEQSAPAGSRGVSHASGLVGGFILALLPGLAALWTEWGRRSRELVLTDKRLLLKTGRVSINVKDIPLDKIQAVHYRQGVFERIAGYGTVSVQSAGLTARESLAGIVNPRKFQNATLGQLRRSDGI